MKVVLLDWYSDEKILTSEIDSELWLKTSKKISKNPSIMPIGVKFIEFFLTCYEIPQLLPHYLQQSKHSSYALNGLAVSMVKFLLWIIWSFYVKMKSFFVWFIKKWNFFVRLVINFSFIFSSVRIQFNLKIHGQTDG